MEEQGMICVDPTEPHSTRFKECLLKLLPNWSDFCQGKGHEVYISNNQKLGDVLADAHKSQLDQNDSLFLMRAAVLLRKSFLQKQESFTGSFSEDSFTSHVPSHLDSHIQGNFSNDEFHGTAISVTNHLSGDNLGIERPSVILDSKDTSTLQLPEFYSVVQPA